MVPYWAIPNRSHMRKSELFDFLEKEGYQTSKDERKWELIELVQRVDRQLLCYDKCSMSELSVFRKQRSLQPLETDYRAHRTEAAAISWTRMKAVKSLRQADDDQRFVNFNNLSAELRVMVIGEYVAQFPAVVEAPEMPPLALTSKRQMQEVMPVFLSNTTVKLIMRQRKPWNHRCPKLTFQGNMLHFITLTSATNLALIRKLEIQVHLSDVNPVYVNIHVGPHKRSVTVTRQACTGWPGTATIKEIRRKSRKILANMIRREGAEDENQVMKKTFKMEDFWAFRTALEKACEEMSGKYS